MFACVEKNLFSKYICKYVANNLQFGKTVREKGKSDDLCFFVIIKGLDTQEGMRGWNAEKMCEAMWWKHRKRIQGEKKKI